MNCFEFKQQTRDWILQGGLPEAAGKHSANCAECAQWLDRERRLSEALSDLADSAGLTSAPPHIEERVLAAFRARSRRSRSMHPAWLAAAAAVLIVIGLAAFRDRKAPVPHRAVPVAMENPFHVLAPGTAIEPEGFAPVIRMRLPRRELRRIGLAAWEPAPGAGTGSLEVDVLVGRDGVAKAVRLVRNSEGYIQ